MAVVYITEFARMGRDASGLSMPTVADEPAVVNQVVAITASTVQSSAFGALTKFIRVHVDAVCSIELGANPTATVTTRRMAANTTEYFSVPLGGSFKLAAIINT